VLQALAWVLYDQGWLTLENRALNTWLAILGLSLVLGIGLGWSILRRRLSTPRSPRSSSSPIGLPG